MFSVISDLSSITNRPAAYSHRYRSRLTTTRRKAKKPTSPKEIVKQVFVLASFAFSCYLIDRFTMLVFQTADPLHETNLRGGDLRHQTQTLTKQQLLLMPQLPLNNERQYAATNLHEKKVVSPFFQEQNQNTLSTVNEADLRGGELHHQTLTLPQKLLPQPLHSKEVSNDTKIGQETISSSSSLKEEHTTTSNIDENNPRGGKLQYQQLTEKQSMGNERQSGQTNLGEKRMPSSSLQEKHMTTSTMDEINLRIEEILKQTRSELQNQLCRLSCSNYGIRYDGEPACCGETKSTTKKSATLPPSSSPTLSPPTTSSLHKPSSTSSPTQEVQWTTPPAQQEKQMIRPYNYLDIEKSAAIFEGYYARLLLFDGEGFSWWSMLHKNFTTANSAGGERATQAIPLLIHALTENFPERFAKGQPPFQLMTSDGDAVNFGACTSNPSKCDMNSMPPLLVHGSVPARANEYPFIKAYPNWNYGQCLYDYKILNRHGSCESPWFSTKSLLRRAESVKWDDLIPTLVWRGSDHAFLPHVDEYKVANYHRNGKPMVNHIREDSTQEELVTDLLNKTDELTPRWRAVAWTVQEDMALQQQQQNATTGRQDRWIDVRFFETGGHGPYHMEWNKRGVKVKADEIMHSPEMANYKYQIDIGGGGGTTWRGTLTKLAMPGVLFHHETLMQDWFYKGLFLPWKHYIPVDWDLGNLKEQYEWAEANPGRCKEISQAATELVKYIMSEEYMETLYQRLYRDHLGQIIDAYQPTELEKQKQGSEVQQHFNTIYQEDGFTFRKVFQCDNKECEVTETFRMR